MTGLLRAQASADGRNANWRLALLLAERGDLDELRARAAASDEYASEQLANLLAACCDLEELRSRPTPTGTPPIGS
jgi:hypothetical protein